MHYNKVSFQELLDCFDNDLENNADNLEHNAEKLQEILNRIMQRIMSIITSALTSPLISQTCINSGLDCVQCVKVLVHWSSPVRKLQRRNCGALVTVAALTYLGRGIYNPWVCLLSVFCIPTQSWVRRQLRKQ